MGRRAKEFIEFALEHGVLSFGQFILKSGRESPYFFDIGRISTGAALAELGRFYARRAQQSEIAFEALFGPAYKGIPLAVATSIAIAEEFGRDLPVAFNRKELKDHGEGGELVGGPLRGQVLIVDDVITAGTAVRESVALIRHSGASPAGLLIAIDRQERGQGTHSAVAELESRMGLRVRAIVTLDDIVDYLRHIGSLATELRALEDYRKRYGVAKAG